MNNVTEIFQKDKNRLLKFIDDFGKEEIYVWCRTTLDLLFKKVFFVKDVCLMGKLLSGLHNIYYYYDKHRDDECCVELLAISLYVIGLQVGALKFDDPIEKMNFFYEYLDEEDWAGVKTDIQYLNAYDLTQLSVLHNAYMNSELLPATVIGLQTATIMSVYLSYKY